MSASRAVEDHVSNTQSGLVGTTSYTTWRSFAWLKPKEVNSALFLSLALQGTADLDFAFRDPRAAGALAELEALGVTATANGDTGGVTAVCSSSLRSATISIRHLFRESLIRITVA
jgi:hypothetical protein